ncbi:hypothetical protein GSI_09577 [Ganoderma sinense ZZ0214-1]|uniref:Uncharacterized protein n=1 Tax=Ganoderma sinense ZZ0214-1 TaxID=1077348 RepID=A0A2G8S3E3_9APHY|nr:hypothetical protein GSI_09577 [Ganoderma sinense ZZ0214-1]
MAHSCRRHTKGGAVDARMGSGSVVARARASFNSCRGRACARAFTYAFVRSAQVNAPTAIAGDQHRLCQVALAVSSRGAPRSSTLLWRALYPLHVATDARTDAAAADARMRLDLWWCARAGFNSRRGGAVHWSTNAFVNAPTASQRALVASAVLRCYGDANTAFTRVL